VGDSVGEGDPDCAAEDDGDGVREGDAAPWVGDIAGDREVLVAAGDGDAVMAAGDPVTDVAEELGLAWPVFGTTATGRVPEAAKTAAPSATRPAMTTTGTTATCLPSGRRSRQLGQKPETGVVT
jgi:hypothetical protein